MEWNIQIFLIIAWVIVIYETTVIRTRIEKVQKDIEELSKPLDKGASIDSNK